MEKMVAYYWQELNKRYSSNQVFLILLYWTLSVYQQIMKGKEPPDKIEDWRFYLRFLFEEAMNYDLKESAVRLSDRIEWTLLANDKPTTEVLEHFSWDMAKYFGGNRELSEKSMTEKLQETMDALIQTAESNMLYSMTPVSIKNIGKSFFMYSHVKSIADFCCGGGGLGIAVWQQLKEPEKTAYYGMDMDSVMCDICTLMTYICGISQSIVRGRDILSNIETQDSEKYDLVLLDVPRGQNRKFQTREYESLLKDIGQRNIFADWLYILRALNAMSDSGRGMVIVTPGTLTRKNEDKLRRKIVSYDWIEAVVTLPANLYANTRTGSEIILFNKKKEKNRQNKILFIDISKYFLRDNRNSYSISQDGIDLATDIFHKYYEVHGISSIVDVSRIDEEICSLKPLRYMGMQKKKDTNVQTLSLGDIAHIARGVQLKKEEEEALCLNGTAFYLNIRDIQEGRICYEDARRISPKSRDWHEKFEIREDDILITSKGASFKIAIVEENPPEAYICGNLTLLRVNQSVYHPYILYEFLTSEEGLSLLESIQSGTTIRILNNTNLERLPIPLYNSEIINQVGNQLKEKRKKYETELRQIVESYQVERKILLELVGMKA